MFLVDAPKLHKTLFFIGLSFAGYGVFVLLQGVWQLHRTLNPKKLKDATLRPRPALTVAQIMALPPSPAQTSVTEGTTELLFTDADRRVAQRIPRKSADTADIDDERLM